MTYRNKLCSAIYLRHDRYIQKMYAHAPHMADLLFDIINVFNDCHKYGDKVSLDAFKYYADKAAILMEEICRDPDQD